ncbi:hypothetical protein [Flavobacterium sp. ZB4P13]|uniref:hypothetical protein n=1 Tax=Flavobacterium sp. ZB4P13 TaxID=3401728 RepID=UPI003AAFB1E4
MGKLIKLLVIILFFTNCSKNDEETSNPVIGEWKLIKVEQNDGANNISITDYTNQNIIYKFETNSNININNAGYNSGNYNYEYKNDYLSGFPSSGETKILLVVINNQKWTYKLISGKMKLGQSYVDGPDLYLEKK